MSKEEKVFRGVVISCSKQVFPVQQGFIGVGMRWRERRISPATVFAEQSENIQTNDRVYAGPGSVEVYLWYQK
jgi:hypothetical protein